MAGDRTPQPHVIPALDSSLPSERKATAATGPGVPGQVGARGMAGHRERIHPRNGKARNQILALRQRHVTLGALRRLTRMPGRIPTDVPQMP
jgi:hypothetical protein